LKSLTLNEKVPIIKTYVHPYKILKNEISGIVKKIHPPNDEIRYRRSILNRNGDQTTNIGHKLRNFKPMSVARIFNPDTYVMKKITEFIRWCRNEHIPVFLTWPGTIPLRSDKLELSNQFLQSLVTFLSKTGVEIIGRPEDFFFPQSYLYNSVNHLNTKGVTHRTRKIIHFLKKNQKFIQWQHEKKFVHETMRLDILPYQKNANICFNGNMEMSTDNSVDGWRPFTDKEGLAYEAAEWDNSAAHSGIYSLKLVNTSGGKNLWIGKVIRLPAATHRIHVEAWSKSENILDTDHYGVNIRTIFKDGSFKWRMKGLHFPDGTHDWVRIHTTFNVKDGAVAIQPYLLLHETTGTAWFDDISIVAIPEHISFGTSGEI